jgi:hypothetical protein
VRLVHILQTLWKDERHKVLRFSKFLGFERLAARRERGGLVPASHVTQLNERGDGSGNDNEARKGGSTSCDPLSGHLI